jgi:catechol 2,3-dioxygenase-like lactoylglutathione lyase family enzyme
MTSDAPEVPQPAGLGAALKFHHVCLVVPDLDRAEAYLTRLGIGPWRDYPPLTDYVELDVPDRTAFMECRYRLADVGAVQFQLCQPSEKRCPQRDFLDSHGPGVFQVGFEVPEVDRAQAAAAALGLGHVMSGRRSDGSGFVYLDTVADIGTHVVARQTPARSD